MGMSKSAGGNDLSQTVSRSRDREMGNTATSRLSVISHSHQMKNGGGSGTPGGTPAAERNAHMENMLSNVSRKFFPGFSVEILCCECFSSRSVDQVMHDDRL